jgi:hypothetical protein
LFFDNKPRPGRGLHARFHRIGALWAPEIDWEAAEIPPAGDTRVYDIYKAVTGYFTDLGSFLSDRWQTMTPNTYIVMLVIVALFGWIMMRNQAR